MEPVAQDFAAIFGYGEHNNRRINNLDAIGVSLAANQANYRLLKETIKEKDTEIEELKKRLSELEALVQSLVSAQEK